jgi:hypothetical protein
MQCYDDRLTDNSALFEMSRSETTGRAATYGTLIRGPAGHCLRTAGPGKVFFLNFPERYSRFNERHDDVGRSVAMML